MSSLPPTPWTVRECQVTFKDLRGFTHTIRVHTTSLMRAAAHALKQLEEGDLLEGCDLTGEAQVEIVTRTVHTIQIGKVKEWLESGGTPRDMAIKRELQARSRPPR